MLMPAAALGFLVGCGWFGIFMVAHIAVLHLRRRERPSSVLTRTLLAAATAAAVTVAIASFASWGELLLAELYTLLVIACFFVLYAPFFYTIYTSLSVQTLILLMESGGRVSLDRLAASFASYELFERRLRTMLASDYLTADHESFRLTLRGRRVARVFAAMKAAWRLGPGG
jgi:hypothetical protein